MVFQPIIALLEIQDYKTSVISSNQIFKPCDFSLILLDQRKAYLTVLMYFDLRIAFAIFQILIPFYHS